MFVSYLKYANLFSIQLTRKVLRVQHTMPVTQFWYPKAMNAPLTVLPNNERSQNPGDVDRTLISAKVRCYGQYVIVLIYRHRVNYMQSVVDYKQSLCLVLAQIFLVIKT